jgi:hypothetical protein
MFTFAATVLGKYVMLATWHILKRCHMYVVWHSVEIYFRKKGMQVTATTMGNSLVASTL